MCGVCGAIGFEKSAGSGIVRRMNTALTHRGPDDEGFAFADGVALGMRRLGIIDLAGGHQPLSNEKNSVSVICNGEIYNFKELRHQLEGNGHLFQTQSDTEVIVHAYEEWGTECVHRLRGIFAFAVLDERLSHLKKTKVFLARDRYGIKPLYYTMANGTFLFASELRALLSSGRVARALNKVALESYLLFGSVSEPETMVEGVFYLPPGHWMTVEVNNPSAAFPHPYWDPLDQEGASEGMAGDSEGPHRGLRGVLVDTMRAHLVADVPVGVFLSGGIDSTAIVALAAQETRDLHTLTVVFPQQDRNEAEFALRTARRWGTHHHEVVITEAEILSDCDDAVKALDQPSIDGVNTFFVSRAGRAAGLKVALSGLGGDEIFGGYDTFRWVPRLMRLSEGFRWVSPVWRALRMSSWNGSSDAFRKLASLWEEPAAFPHPYFFHRLLFTPLQARTLMGTHFRGGGAWRERALASAHGAHTLEGFSAVSYLETVSYLANTLLRDADAMSMAHSLEVRVPFLDHRLTGFVARQPEAVKRAGGVPKGFLTNALGDLIPEGVVRQRKQMFTLPWESWLRGSLGSRAFERVGALSPSLQGVLQGDAVEAVWTDFQKGKTRWSRPWSLFVLNEWVHRNIDEKTTLSPAPVAAGRKE